MKTYLDNLVKKYETKSFISSDPIQFPHRYKDKTDIEIAGFISSLFSFGKREMFIKQLDFLFSLCETPQELIKDYKKFNLDDFVYRFIKNKDLNELLKILNKLYFKDKLTLEELFLSDNRLNNATQYFYNNSSCTSSSGFCFMFAKPENKSAMKRLNMFLRWMVRDGEFNLLKRKQNDFRAAQELTDKLKEFDSIDPVKYDFALFGLGVNEN